MIDELLAMLEPATVRLGMGRGGLPELTAIDIDGALGMVKDKFAGAVFILLAGESTRSWPQVDGMLAYRQFGEWRERADRLVTAQITLATAQRSEKWERHTAIMRANQALEGARAAMWPQLIEEKYQRVRKAVIAELRTPRICGICNGRGSVQTDTVAVDCLNCLGVGRVSVSDRQRSLMLDMEHTTYARAGWRKVYEWTYRLVTDAASTGRHEFASALREAA